MSNHYDDPEREKLVRALEEAIAADDKEREKLAQAALDAYDEDRKA